MTMLSVVIPAYNEENGISEIVNRVLAIRAPLAALGISLELIVVDDGSRDKTVAVVSQCRDVQLIRHPTNRGYGAAIKTGFRNAGGEYLAFLDADGTYPPESLPDMCRAAIEKNADLVVGSRMSGAHSEMPVTRRIGNFAFARLLSLISSVPVRDTASGMRIIRRTSLPALYPLPDGLDFTPAMSTRAIHENLKIVEVPIAYSERVGRSKLSVMRDGVRFTNTIVWTALTYNPVRILGGFGIVLGLLAILLGVLALVGGLFNGSPVSPLGMYAAFGAVVLAIAGVSLFALGVMFSYLIALFTKKPVRRGMFGRVIFDPPLDYQFGWMGLVSIAAGIAFSLVAFVMSLSGWNMDRLWLGLIVGALLIVIGIQLAITWLVLRVLEELARRQVSTQRDLTADSTALEAPATSHSPAEAR